MTRDLFAREYDSVGYGRVVSMRNIEIECRSCGTVSFTRVFVPAMKFWKSERHRRGEYTREELKQFFGYSDEQIDKREAAIKKERMKIKKKKGKK